MTEQLLSPEALAEIEALEAKSFWSFEGNFVGQYVPIVSMDRDALCRTLRAAWAERDEAVKARNLFVSLKRGQTERADEIEARALELLQENAALRERLVRAQSQAEWQKSTIENLTVGVTGCAERLATAEQQYEAGFEAGTAFAKSVIEDLQSRLAQVEKELTITKQHRDDLIAEINGSRS